MNNVTQICVTRGLSGGQQLPLPTPRKQLTSQMVLCLFKMGVCSPSRCGVIAKLIGR